ncbi:MAG: hypothetical protein NTY01_04235 [Verrucomicrobia bacterium]|nr:hypothetical protein [Verrucomicrobiota bacterium]
MPQPLQTPKASGFPDWLRWVLVLPAAIVSFFGVQFAVAIGLSIFPFLSDSFVQFWNSIMGSAFLVVGGAQTAPKHRFTVALTLSVIWTVFGGLVIAARIFIPGHYSDAFWWLCVCNFIGIVATVVVCVVYHQMETKTRLKDAWRKRGTGKVLVVFQDFRSYSDEERAQWIHLRGLEWFAWPAFVSQAVIPVLLVWLQSWWIVPAFLVVDLCWRFVCHRLVVIALAEAGVFVAILRWPAALAASIYLFTQNLYGFGAVALVWPLIATPLSVVSTYAARFLGTRADLVGVKAAFAEKVIRL